MNNNGLALSAIGVSSSSLARIYKGNGELADLDGSSHSGTTRPIVEGPSSATVANGVTLNLSGASIAEVSKTVLGDILGVDYSVSDKLKGAITLRTAHPVSKAGLLGIFEAVLHNEGAALVVRDKFYEVLPSADAAAAGTPLRRALRSDGADDGTSTEIIPLRFASASEIERVLKSASPQAGILHVDTARNLVVVAGSSAELSAIDELVSVFDVDTMRGMSFALFPVENADPQAIAGELDTIFANDRDGPTKGMIRFIGNQRLRSVLVISPRAEYVHKAEVWIRRIDKVNQESQKQVHVYHVENRAVADLAKLLQKVYAGSQGSGPGAAASSGSPALGPGSAAPSEPTRSTSSGGGSAGSEAPPAGLSGPFGTLGGLTASAASVAPVVATSVADVTSPVPAALGALPADDRDGGISVVADETNNSLVITATAAQYRRALRILETLDSHPTEVLLEATIAEVTLNDQLQFGVRWFLQNKGKNSSASFTDSSGVVSAVASAGLSLLTRGQNVNVLINALSNVTDVNLLSHPSLMVLENRKASLQVGDEVPILTQTQQSAVLASATTTSNSVSYRNTGILLNITPRVGRNGFLILDLEQEVSDTKSNTTSGIDSPAFTQRRVQTTVSVKAGETIVLAGMIQDKATRSRDQVPLLGDIPLIGNAFKNKTDSVVRTELLLALTPQLVKDSQQIDAVAEEFRESLNMSTRPQRAAGPDFNENVSRLLR